MTQNNEPIITLSLPLSGVNGLLAGASRLPYADVAALIHDVQQQAHEQLQRMQSTQDELANPVPSVGIQG